MLKELSPCHHIMLLDYIIICRLIVNAGMLVPTAKTTNAAASLPVRTDQVLRSVRS